MSQNRILLFAFTLGAVLSVCMLTNVSGPEGKEPDSTMSTELNPSSKSQRKTTAEPVSVNTSTPQQESRLSTSYTPPSHSTTNITLKDLRNWTHSTEQYTHPIPMGTPAEESTNSKPAPATTSVPNTDQGEGSENTFPIAGICILILILVIITTLAVILIILWKKGKTYSFDLMNDEHETLQNHHPGIFEQAKGSTMKLEFIQEDNPNKSDPVANGCSGETLDSGESPCSEQQNVPEEDSFTSDLCLNSPVKKVEFNLDPELIGGEPELQKAATEEPTDNDNENNNNDTNTGNDSPDLFTEINLDDAQ